MKKFTYEYVSNFFRNNGCEMLEEKYINNRILMRFKCHCGVIGKIRFFEFKEGRRCKECGIRRRVEKQKLSYSYVENYFKEYGCELLEKEYIDSKTKMKYRCVCENISEITFNRFQQGCRCMECGNKIKSEKQKHTYNYVKQYFEDRGCELLEQEYTNRYTPMKYKCVCGNILKIFFNSFQQKQKINCKKCEGKRRSGKNNHRWIKDREVVRESEKFRQKCYKMLKKVLKRTGQKKNDRTRNLLGYTIKELHNHVSSHLNWENVKNKKWHLDHIFPIKAFIDYKIKDTKLINSLDNLQPLSQEENLAKSCRYNKDEFEEWLRKKDYGI